MGKSGIPEGQGFKKKSKAKMYYQQQSRRGGNAGRRGGHGSWGSGNQDRGLTSLTTGMKGFLCTTNFKEKEAVHEAYNILNEYYDENDEINSETSLSKEVTTTPDSLNKAESSNNGGASSTATLNPETESSAAGSDATSTTGGSIPKKANDDEDDDGDIESALNEEIQSLKKTGWRFKSVHTGVKNVVFLKTTIADPVKLVHKILEDVTSKKEQKSRFLLRMVPIEVTCKADVTHIVEAGKVLFEKHLKTGCNSYQIFYKSRYNNVLSRELVIRSLAEAVSSVNSMCVVNLNDPKYVVVVEILKNICCLSIITDFNKFRKYNLIETSSDPKAEKGDDLEPSPGFERRSQQQQQGNKGQMDVDVVSDGTFRNTDSYEICLEKSSMDECGTGSSVSRGRSVSSDADSTEGKAEGGSKTVLD